VLKDTVLMAIDEINAKGGVMGKSWSRLLIRRPTGRCSPKTKQLLGQDKVP
jgi:urea transport system substrate-binding protein